MKRPMALLGIGMIVAGWVVMGAGWAGVQATGVVAKQMAYLASGGLVGLSLVVVGVSLLRYEDTRDTRRLLEEMRDQLDDLDDRLVIMGREEGGPSQPLPPLAGDELRPRRAARD
ncbi:MAG: hypothetical protein QOI86_2609 [Actinomycetota bacterium]|jgi:hypothetical protein|nr:hypothetical protein [Actinomycetota bacterium]